MMMKEGLFFESDRGSGFLENLESLNFAVSFRLLLSVCVVILFCSFSSSDLICAHKNNVVVGAGQGEVRALAERRRGGFLDFETPTFLEGSFFLSFLILEFSPSRTPDLTSSTQYFTILGADLDWNDYITHLPTPLNYKLHSSWLQLLIYDSSE